MFKTKYRIVTDSYNGYEAQFKPWYSPFWFQCNWTNTSYSVGGARDIIRAHEQKVVEYYDSSN